MCMYINIYIKPIYTYVSTYMQQVHTYVLYVHIHIDIKIFSLNY